MISLQRFCRSVKRYLSRYGGKDPGVVVFCLLCGRRMNQHGHYPRGICRRRRCQTIPIYRRYCRRCKVTVSLLPDFVKPHGRVENGCRELVIRLQVNGKVSVAEISRRFNISTRTVYRWKWQARKVADAVLPGMSIEAAAVRATIPGIDQMGGVAVLAATPGTDQVEAEAVPAATPGTDQVGAAAVSAAGRGTNQVETTAVRATIPGIDQMGGVAVLAATPGTDQGNDIKLKAMLRLADVLYHSTCTLQCRYSLHLTALSYINRKFCPASAKDCA